VFATGTYITVHRIASIQCTVYCILQTFPLEGVIAAECIIGVYVYVTWWQLTVDKS